MLILRAQDQARALTMAEAIEAVGEALAHFSGGRANVPLRTGIPVPQQGATALFMPALVAGAGSLGVKYVSVFPRNAERGKPVIHGAVLLADPETGEPLALLEGSYLTALRTGAASGLATRHLARPDAAVAAIIGTGTQARMALRAVAAVRRLREVRLYNRRREKAEAFAREMAAQLGPEAPRFRISPDPGEAVRGADIVVTATTSHTPVFPSGAVGSGVHVCAIGSFRPDMQEVPGEVVARADKVVVESREAALAEAGDLQIPIRQGLWDAGRLHAELGEIHSGHRPGRERADELTLFKSVGLAVMDVVVGRRVYERARQLGIGQEIDLGVFPS